MAIDDLSKMPWVLLPGTLCTDAVFEGFLNALGVMQSARRYVMLDRPKIADYRADFEELSKDTIVCGFSLGAIVAAHFADRLAAGRLILFGLNPFADDPAKGPSRHALARDVVEHGGALALQSRLSDIFGPNPDMTRNAICQMAEETVSLIDAQTQLALSRPGARPALQHAAMPVLVVTGARDRAAPSIQGRTAAQTAPNGQFRELADLGHFALMEDPTTCANAVRRWHEALSDHN